MLFAQSANLASSNTSLIKFREHKYFSIYGVCVKTLEEMNGIKAKEHQRTGIIKWTLHGIL